MKGQLCMMVNLARFLVVTRCLSWWSNTPDTISFEFTQVLKLEMIELNRHVSHEQVRKLLIDHGRCLISWVSQLNSLLIDGILNKLFLLITIFESNPL